MPDFGLLPSGFNRKRLPDIREALVEAWRAAFGDNADTDSDTPDGHIIDIISTELALAWEATEDAHVSAFLQTSEGVSLDLWSEAVGLTRLAASFSTIPTVYPFGTATTVVLAGSVVSTEDQGDRFALDAAATIGASTDAYVVEVVAVTVGENYRITIDGNDHDYVAIGGDGVDDVRDGLRAAVNAGPTVAVANDAGNRPAAAGGGAILVITGAAGLVTTATADTPANVDLFDAEALAGATAETSGAISAVAGSLNVIETPITGWTGIANIVDADEGRAVESDLEYRTRIRLLLRAVGSATPDAITSRLLEITIANGFTSDVEAAAVFENTSDVVDGAGRPPHSFEAVVLGGLDAEVGQQIWDHKPAGIATFGSTTEGVVDVNGAAHTVDFSRPTELFAHLLITITKGEDFPTLSTEAELATQVEANVAAYGDANLSLGDDLYRVALNPTILAALGGSPTAASDIVITTGTTPGPLDPTPPLVASDIAVTPLEIARLDTGRIAVVFV